MARSLGNIGDFFPDKDIRCRIRGCNNVWRFSGEEALHQVVDGKTDRPERMCDPCYEKFRKLENIDAPCATPGCSNTWVWDRLRQLESQLRGHATPSPGFCKSCQKTMQETQDKQIPCRARGCARTWTWTAREQLLSKADKPATRLCDACFSTLKSLNDGDVPCRMRRCDKTWRWNKYQQLEHKLSGKDLDNPPRRMCGECFGVFRALQDIQVPCKVQECKRTWCFSAYDQLDHRLANGADAPPPARMCRECYDLFMNAKDRPIPCENRGCTRTWLYTKSMQLQDRLSARDRPVPRMCDACQEKLHSLEDKQVPCKAPGCSKTWTYPAIEQLRDLCHGKTEPTPHRCAACEQFLAENEPKTVKCKQCGTDMQWSAYEQLLCKLGTFVKPIRCAKCTEHELALKKPEKPAARVNHHVVRMPSTGPWQKDERISHWPPHLTYDVIEAVEKSDIRIVAFGDDLTLSSDEHAESWPCLMEQALNKSLGKRATVAVVNSGIRNSTSEQAALRLARDVIPFDPHLVIFSFAFADSLLWLNHRTRQWRPNLRTEGGPEAIETLFKQLTESSFKLLYWTTNPVFPEDHIGETPSAEYQRWAREQTSSHEHCLRQTRQLCSAYNVPTLDLHSRFEVNGTRSAKRWMTDWYNHNGTGAHHIATWFAQHVLRENLLPL